MLHDELLLREEILDLLGCIIRPCKSWDIYHINLGGGFKDFLCSPLLGEDSHLGIHENPDQWLG